MRESVKNKKKLIVATIAFVIALVMAIGLGLFYNPKDSDTSSVFVGGISDVDFGNVIGSNPSGNSGSGTAVHNGTELLNLIKNNQSGYLANNITDYKADTNMSGRKYSGTLDGCGYSIDLIEEHTEWTTHSGYTSHTFAGVGGSVDRASGIFVAVNSGTIKNVTFNCSKTIKINPGNDKHTLWEIGVVAGINDGTIENVRVNLNGAQLQFHYNNNADKDKGHKVTLGGVCGAQNGILRNIYVNMTGSTLLQVDTKNYGAVTSSNRGLQMGMVGGVYGAYTGTTAANNTYNLMVKASEQTLLEVKNTKSAGTGSAQTRLFDAVGAVAGLNIDGVRGVVWDYQGSFATDSYSYHDNNNYVIDSYQSSKVAALTGIPIGYYSPSAERACMNGAYWIKDYKDNIFTSLTTIPFVNQQPGDRDNSDTATGKISSDEINMSNFDDAKLGGITMYFTDKVNELVVKKDLSSSASTNIIWQAGGSGTIDGVVSTDTAYSVVDYANKPRKFEFKLQLNDDHKITISSGQYFDKMTRYANMSYTGEDYLGKFRASAFNEFSSKIPNTASFNESSVQFLMVDNNNAQLTELRYPRKVGRVNVVSRVNSNCSYVDATNRFCVAPMQITELEMYPANATMTAATTNWTTSNKITVKISGGLAGCMDRIGYRRSDQTDYTYVSDFYYDANNGMSFNITTDTLSTGNVFEIIGYSGDNPVIFTYGSDNSINPSNIQNGSKLYIDTIAPVIDPSALSDLEGGRIWYNNNVSLNVKMTDSLSGFAGTPVSVKCIALDNDGNETGSEESAGVYSIASNTNAAYITFSKYAKYTITLRDIAGNTATYTFVAHIDTSTPVIESISYYTLSNDGKKIDYTFGEDVSRSVFAEATITFGPAGGRLQFASGTSGDEESTSDTVITHTGKTYVAEIKKTLKPDGTYFVFTAISGAGADDARKTNVWSKSNEIILITQATIELTIDRLAMSSLTKTYDGKSDFTGSIYVTNPNEFYSKIGGDINTMITVSGTYYEFYEGEGHNIPENKKANLNAVLIIELRAKPGYGFAITNKQDQNNFYVFRVGGSYTMGTFDNIKENVEATEVGIHKKDITDLKVADSQKTYWQQNPKFEVTTSQLVEGDTLNDLLVEFVTDATKTSNAGIYEVYARISDDCTNYKLPDSYDIKDTWGLLRIIRKTIEKIFIEGELNSITCYQTPDVKAYFYDVEGNRRDLEVIYKNQDKEEIQFIPGKRSEIGKYYYVILMDEDVFVNYANLTDPNMLIGYFNVVGDIVAEGKSYTIRDLDTSTSVIEVEFVNDTIDFYTMINYLEKELRGRLKVYYGPRESTISDINKVGEYIVTLRVADNDPRYFAYAKEYTVQVVPATIATEKDDLTGITKDFDNIATKLNVEDNVSASLKDKLEALLTAEEIANDGILGNYKFAFTYRRNNQNYPNGAVDVGTYDVKLAISGKQIQTIELEAKIVIDTLRLSVVFDFDKYQDSASEIVVDKDNRTITKTFDGVDKIINVSLDATFEAELKRLMGIKDGEDTNSYYRFSNNDLVNAGTYSINLSFASLFYNNISLVDNTVTVQIDRQVINLNLPEENRVYDGTPFNYTLQAEDIELLKTYGVNDPYTEVYLGVDAYDGAVAIRDSAAGRLGVSFLYAGEYRVAIRMSEANDNFRIGNGTINVNIAKVDVNDMLVEATYKEGDVDKTETIARNGEIRKDYNGYDITLNLSQTDIDRLVALGVDTTTELVFRNNVVKNAGRYTATLSINNRNIDFSNYIVSVVINRITLDSVADVYANYFAGGDTGINAVANGGKIDAEYNANAIELSIGDKGREILAVMGIDVESLNFKIERRDLGVWSEVEDMLNVGNYRVKLSIDNDNFNNTPYEFTATISKVKLDSVVSIEMTYGEDRVVEGIDRNQVVEKEFSSYQFTFALSDESKALILTLGAVESELVFSENDIINQGKYDIKFNINNANFEDTSYDFTLNVTNIKITSVVTILANYTNNSGNQVVDEVIANAGKINNNYNAKQILLSISSDSITKLAKFGLTADDVLIEYFVGDVKANEILNAGNYTIKVTIKNVNFDNENPYVINVVVNKVNLQDVITIDAKYADDNGNDKTTALAHNDTLNVSYTSKEVVLALGDKGVSELTALGIDIENDVKFLREMVGVDDPVNDITNAGTYKVTITINDNVNFDNSNPYIVNVVINKKQLNDIVDVIVTYTNEINTKEIASINRDGVFESEYNTKEFTIGIGEKGEEVLSGLGITNYATGLQFNTAGNSTPANISIVNAGTYAIDLVIKNDNVEFTTYTFTIVINKKQIGENVGKFNQDNWLINGETPTEAQADRGVMYNKDRATGIEDYYSLRLEDEAELLKEGFEIVYVYRQVIDASKGIYKLVSNESISKAGTYKITAEISRRGDANWETKVVELWKLDSKGGFAETNGNRVVETFEIAKSDALQAVVEAKDMREAMLPNLTVTYDGLPHGVAFTNEQTAMYTAKGIKPVISSKASYTNAGEYSVVVKFYYLDNFNNNDKNYESAELEATILIQQVKVAIQFEIDEQYKDANGNIKFGEGDTIQIRAYYIDIHNEKIYIDSFVYEAYSGKGDDISYSTVGKVKVDENGAVVKPKEGEEDKYDDALNFKPGNYQVTATIADGNYFYDEEELINFLRFNIKNESGTTNAIVFSLLGFFIAAMIVAGLIVLYFIRKYNPAVQEVDLNGEENF